nr:hypothetical protein [Tanacetum cinerariifolium]
MHDATDADGKEVAKEMVEVITTAKIIVDKFSTAGGELNAANKEPIAIDEEVARKIKAESNADMQDNIDWNKVVEQEISYEEIRPLFEEEYNKVQTLFKEGPEMDAERIKALRKRIRKENVEKDQTTKKQKGDELEKQNAKKQKLEEQQEAEELKRNLEIVLDDEDDVFVMLHLYLLSL